MLHRRFLEEAIATGLPAKGLDQAFAQKIEVSPSMWSQIKSSRPIGDTLARQIERHCEVEIGWLDRAIWPPTYPTPRKSDRRGGEAGVARRQCEREEGSESAAARDGEKRVIHACVRFVVDQQPGLGEGPRLFLAPAFNMRTRRVASSVRRPARTTRGSHAERRGVEDDPTLAPCGQGSRR